MTDATALSALILAGGQGLRMGGVDKGLVDLNHRRMVEHVLERVKGQVPLIMISANRSHPEYQRYGYPVVADQADDFLGPLAGMAQGLRQSTTPWLMVVPCDSPQLPLDLAHRLSQAAFNQNTLAAVAHDGEHLQPAFNLIHRDLLEDLQRYLDQGGRKLGYWLRQQQPAVVDFSDQPQSFINLNSSEQLDQFQQQMQST